ncbi:PadR family transcriptional regulator [Nocardia amamiensis]|uniref:PadR family transcriptional regulator n=1 Tax=Nocardia amamiensis TaxID=404578 RepID=A0ABS0CL74_9NOCA|nr:PadR family transcriptional regulator [Nocardia amamiensis]MBF6297361.1 PadR family transcriptional regulator [Nocardia amamiensis]
MEHEHREFGRRGRRPLPGQDGFEHGRRFRRGGRHGFGPEFGPGFGPGFGPHFGRGRGRGGRGRRGDVRAAVLLLLTERPMHGYELIQQIRERSDDVWRPSPGSIYPALAQLEDEGLVLIEKVAGRKTAKLTETGVEYVTTHRDELGDPWAEVKQDVGAQAMDLRALVGQLMGAVAQVAAAGTPQQAARAAELLTETRKSLYRILAEDETPEK